MRPLAMPGTKPRILMDPILDSQIPRKLSAMSPQVARLGHGYFQTGTQTQGCEGGCKGHDWCFHDEKIHFKPEA